MTDSQRRYGALVGAIVIVIAVGLTFASVPGHDFVRWDDGSFIYLNPLFHRISWENMMQAWSPENGSAVYEPIVYTVLAPIASLAKLNVANPSVNEAGALLNPHPFHTFSLLVHILNSLQVYVLLLLLFPRRHMACTVGALLFGLHPLQVESLAWAAGCDRGINALFALGALLSYVAAIREARAAVCRALYVTAICLGVVAYLAKPVAITVPLAALVIDRFILGRPWKKVLAWYAPWQVLLLPLVILTRSVSSVNAVGNMPIWSRVSVAGDALAWHLYKLVVPFKLGIDYGRTPQYVLSHWWGYATWIAPAALLAGGTILCRDRRLLAALGLWIVALLPDIGLVPFPFQQYSTVADRYDYLALIGPPFAVVVWLSSSRWRYAPATAGVVLVLLAGLSAAQSIIWKDTPALMAQALEVNPSSVLSRLSLASYDAAHGDTAHAEVLYVESIRLAPNDYHTHAGIGTLYVLLGRNADAARELQQAIALKPDCESAHLSQGVLLYEQGKFAAAIPEFKMALTADRLDLSARHNLARALVGAGRSADARLEIEIILMTDPDNKPALDFLKALAGDASRQRR